MKICRSDLEYSDYLDAWILADREGILPSKRIERTEKRRKKSAKWRKDHPGYNKEACRRYREKDREAFRKYQHDYYINVKKRRLEDAKC